MPRSNDERQIAFDCLKLAGEHTNHSTSDRILTVAGNYYAFVLGIDADDAKAKLSAVRQIVEP